MRALRQRRAPGLETYPGLVPPTPIVVVSQKLEEQIAQALLQAQTVGYAFQRLGQESRPELGWRCTKFGNHIIEGLLEYFPEIERHPE